MTIPPTDFYSEPHWDLGANFIRMWVVLLVVLEVPELIVSTVRSARTSRRYGTRANVSSSSSLSSSRHRLQWLVKTFRSRKSVYMGTWDCLLRWDCWEILWPS